MVTQIKPMKTVLIQHTLSIHTDFKPLILYLKVKTTKDHSQASAMSHSIAAVRANL